MKNSCSFFSRLMSLFLFIVFAQSSFSFEVIDEANEELSNQARQKIQSVAGALKSTLKKSITEQGPVEAIGACHLVAQKISANTGDHWQVSRTSLKVRNSINKPMPWVAQVLMDFERRKNNGEKLDQMSHQEIRNGRYYFIKAIPAKGLCLTCHGTSVNAGVSAKLAELYPDDKAIGFKQGDLRGAFIASRLIK